MTGPIIMYENALFMYEGELHYISGVHQNMFPIVHGPIKNGIVPRASRMDIDPRTIITVIDQKDFAKYGIPVEGCDWEKKTKD